MGLLWELWLKKWLQKSGLLMFVIDVLFLFYVLVLGLLVVLVLVFALVDLRKRNSGETDFVSHVEKEMVSKEKT